jgi:hypothetical protein
MIKAEISAGNAGFVPFGYSPRTVDRQGIVKGFIEMARLEGLDLSRGFRIKVDPILLIVEVEQDDG